MAGHPHAEAMPDRGFTLTELLVVIALMAVGTAMAIPVTMSSVNRAKNDSAVSVTQTFIDGARDRAVAERRNVELVFQTPNVLKLQRVEVPSGLKTLVGELQFEAGQKFHKFPSLPDTPDTFGGASAVYFSGTGPWMFTSDGSLIDSAGDVSNGTVFLADPDKLDSARAVTIFGVTGLIRVWKWRGAQWSE